MASLRGLVGLPSPGDLNCYFSLFFNNCSSVIAVIACLKSIFPYNDATKDLVDDIIYGKVLAGMIVTIFVGNFYYTWMAVRLMRSSGRSDVTALPYGINTPAAFAFLNAIVRPSVEKLEKKVVAGQMTTEEVILHAWRVGCIANFISGIVATICGCVGPHLVKVAPRGSLMVALAGLGFTYLGIQQVLVAFKYGYAGLVPLVAACLVFFGQLKTGRVPQAFAIILVGSTLGWAFCQGWEGGGSIATVRQAWDAGVGFHPPGWIDAESFSVIPEVLSTDIGMILPVSLTGAVCTLLNVYGAADAGDTYPIREAMIVDGLTTAVAGLSGSPLGTCVYIGHSQFKAQEGKIVYCIMFACTFGFCAITGLFAAVTAFIPPYAVSPLIMFIGIAITQDALAVCPQRHLAAAIVGLFPPVAEWACTVWSSVGPGPGPPVELFAFGRGSLLLGVIWTSIIIYVVDQDLKSAAIWSFVAALLSAVGMIHQGHVDIWLSHFMDGAGGNWATSPAAFFCGYTLVSLFLGLVAFLVDKGWLSWTLSEETTELTEVDESLRRSVREIREMTQQRMRASHGSVALADSFLVSQPPQASNGSAEVPTLLPEVEMSNSQSQDVA